MFTITQEHLTLLRNMRVGWENNKTDVTHPGAPAIRRFRTYGNSAFYDDLAELLNIPRSHEGQTQEQREHLEIVHRETELALQACLIIGQIRTGTFASHYPSLLPGSTRLLLQEELQAIRSHPEEVELVTLAAKRSASGIVDIALV